METQSEKDGGVDVESPNPGSVSRQDLLKPEQEPDWTDCEIEVKNVIDVLTCKSTNLDYTVVLTWILQVITIWTIASQVGKHKGSPNAGIGTVSSLLLSSFAIGSAIKEELYALVCASKIMEVCHPSQKFGFHLFIVAQTIVGVSVFIATCTIMAQQTTTMDVVINSAGVFVVMQVDDCIVQSVPLTGRTTTKIREALKDAEKKFEVNWHLASVTVISLLLFGITLSLKPSSSSGDDDSASSD